MMTFDVTAQLAPIFSGMVALLAISGVAITASALVPTVGKLTTYFTRANKPTLPTGPAVAAARA